LDAPFRLIVASVSIGAAGAFVIPAAATRASPHRGAGRAGWRSERIRTAASAQRQRSFLVCHRERACACRLLGTRGVRL